MGDRPVVGRTRRKLALLLSGLSCSMLATRHLPRRTHEITCDPANLWPAQGAWRTNVNLDTYAWEGQVDIKTTYMHNDRPHEVYKGRESVGSYQTMTDLVKSKLFVTDYDCGYELYTSTVTPLSAARASVGWRP